MMARLSAIPDCGGNQIPFTASVRFIEDQTAAIANSSAIISACFNTVSVASNCISGGYRHALGQQTVECLIIRQQLGRMDALHFFQACLQQCWRQLGVDAFKRRFQSPGQQHLIVTATLRPVAIRSNIRRMDIVVAQALEQPDGEVFDGGFSEPGHSRCHGPAPAWHGYSLQARAGSYRSRLRPSADRCPPDSYARGYCESR